MDNIRRNILIILVVLSISLIGVVFAEISNVNDTATTVSDEPNIDNHVVTTVPDSGFNMVDISAGSTHAVERIDKCVDEKYIESTPQLGTCQSDAVVCDELNTSCHNATENYSCVINTIAVEKTARKCNVKGYHISKYNLNTEEYSCSVDTADKDSTTIICDSKYDGNGDGICTSGESCMKYVIDKNSIKSFEKNSKDEYAPTDDSYFLNKINVEEVQ